MAKICEMHIKEGKKTQNVAFSDLGLELSVKF